MPVLPLLNFAPDATPSDADMAVRLGLAAPGQPVGPALPVRAIADYGPRELKAVEEFAMFKVPPDYQHQPLTRAGEFLIELTDNPDLAHLYVHDPATAVSDEVFPGLSQREQQALISRDEGALQIAAKGMRVSNSPRDTFILSLLRQSKLAHGLQRTIKASLRDDDLPVAFAEWMAANGFDVRPSHIAAAVKGVNGMMLLPWTGVYVDPETDDVLAVMGSPATRNSLVYWNGERIRDFNFYNGTLAWRAADGQPHAGLLRFNSRSLGRGPRAVEGTITPEGADALSAMQFSGVDVDARMMAPPKANGSLEAYLGHYKTTGVTWDTAEINSLTLAIEDVVLNHMLITDFTFEDGVLTWADAYEPHRDGRLTFLTDPITGMRFFFGSTSAGAGLNGSANLCGYAPNVNENNPADGLLTAAAVSEHVWRCLETISRDALRERAAPFWHEWQKTRMTTQVINRVLLSVLRRLCD